MTNPIAGEYRNRMTGLVVFGVLEILLGALFLVVAAITLLGGLVATRAGGELQWRALVPALGLYGAIGVGAIWLGIGSILARRWARALWVCLSATALVMGVIALPFGFLIAGNLPRQMAAAGQSEMPAAALVIIRVAVVGFMALFYVVIPGVLFLFYRSPHVQRTCEIHDPQERWTDRCPLPVLAPSLLAALGGLGMLLLLGFGGFFPLFGTYATGIAGGALILLAGGAMLGFAWGLYRLKTGAWWGLLVFLVILSASNTLTFWRADLGELYLRMGFDSRTAAAASQFGQMSFVRWMGPVWVVPWLGWLLYIRRFFQKEAASAKP